MIYILKKNINLIAFFSTCLLVTSSSYAKDDVTFNCSLNGYGYQTSDKSGPWLHKLGSFNWTYNSEMIEVVTTKNSENEVTSCKPAWVESPALYLDKEKYIYITGNRCITEDPSYFYSITNLFGIEVQQYLGEIDHVLNDKSVRVVFGLKSEDNLELNDKTFKSVYFECTVK